MTRPAVLVTHPGEYAIRGGANPHTRDESNELKSVDREEAWRQWNGYVDALVDGGVDVYVAEPRRELTGMVFAANAGFLPERLADEPVRDKTFYPSHFTAEHRQPESEVFARFMRQFGFQIAEYDTSLAFEGEADAFPVGRGAEASWLVTWGFRSDREIGEWVDSRVDGPVHQFELADPAFYHGDCIACDLGGDLLAWPEGVTTPGRFRDVFEGRLLELDDEAAGDFVANSFYVETDRDRLLYAPAEIDATTVSRIEERGVDVVRVDISEFFGKGGGGPKCLVFNLGPVDPADSEASSTVRDFRRRRSLDVLRARNALPDPTR